MPIDDLDEVKPIPIWRNLLEYKVPSLRETIKKSMNGNVSKK